MFLGTSLGNLLDVALLKALAHDICISAVKQNGHNVVMSFIPLATADPVKITEAVRKRRGALAFNISPPTLVYKIGTTDERFMLDLRELLKQFR